MVLPELLLGLPSPGAGDSDSPTYVKEYSWTQASDGRQPRQRHSIPQAKGERLRPRAGPRQLLHQEHHGASAGAPRHGDPEPGGVRPCAPAGQKPRALPCQWYFTLSLQGGVDNQVLLDSKSGLSAFWRRDTTWVMENSGFTSGPDEVFPVPAGIGLVSDLNRQVTGVLGAGNYGAYQGYVGSELSADAAGRLHYGYLLFEKLKGLEKKIDPGDFVFQPTIHSGWKLISVIRQR